MKRLYALVAIFLALGCGSAPMPVVVGAPGHRDMLFEAEIQTNRVPGMTVYDLVSHLRPEYLRSRGANSLRDLTPPTAIVYVDNSKYGSLDTLRSMSADNVLQIQYFTANDAATRFGMDHAGGAILITTRIR
ncbi:MAG: hypothetical protein ABIQ55_05120 [Gemmatimonadaceae bacterium]